MIFLRVLIFLALLMFVPGVAWSQQFTPTIASGAGGAGRAAIDGGESSFLNPATLAHLRAYYFGLHYQHGDHPAEGVYNRYAIQIADGTTSNIVPGAFSYYRQSIDLPGRLGSRTDSDYQVSIGGLVHPMFSLGLAAHYLMQSGQNRDDSQLNGNVGMIFNPGGSLGIALVGYDIIPIQRTDSVDRRLNASYAVGLNYAFPDILRVRLDLVRPDIQPFQDHRTNVMAGLESYFTTSFAFLLGVQSLETSDQTNMTAGLGFHGPRLSVDYSFQKDVRAAGGVRHGVDLWMPL